MLPILAGFIANGVGAYASLPSPRVWRGRGRAANGGTTPVTADPETRVYPLRREDDAAWLPLWRGYQSSTKSIFRRRFRRRHGRGCSIQPSLLPGSERWVEPNFGRCFRLIA